jgi:hypothetical protein
VSAPASRGAALGALAVLLGLPAAWAAGLAASGRWPLPALPLAAAAIVALGLLAGHGIGRLPETLRLRAATGAVFGALAVGTFAVFPAAVAGMAGAGAPAVLAMAVEQPDAQRAAWSWWRDAKLLRHRNTVEDVDALLVRLDRERGHTHMTVERVFAVLDAHDPGGLVSERLGQAPQPPRGRIGLPDRTCAYSEGGAACDRPVRAVNAKYCERHARESRKEKTRARVAKHRRRGVSSDGLTGLRIDVAMVRGNAGCPPPALANHGSASGENGSQASGILPGGETGLYGQK